MLFVPEDFFYDLHPNLLIFERLITPQIFGLSAGTVVYIVIICRLSSSVCLYVFMEWGTARTADNLSALHLPKTVHLSVFDYIFAE